MNDSSDGRLFKQFGENLKKIRAEKNLSTRDLADLAEVNLGNLNDLELGKRDPHLSMIYALARALQIDPRELMP